MLSCGISWLVLIWLPSEVPSDQISSFGLKIWIWVWRSFSGFSGRILINFSLHLCWTDHFQFAREHFFFVLMSSGGRRPRRGSPRPPRTLGASEERRRCSSGLLRRSVQCCSSCMTLMMSRSRRTRHQTVWAFQVCEDFDWCRKWGEWGWAYCSRSSCWSWCWPRRRCWRP